MDFGCNVKAWREKINAKTKQHKCGTARQNSLKKCQER